MADTNPFFSPSALPYQLPPFAEIRDEHYRPAFERGFAEQLAEVEAVTASPEPATFENTFLPLERSGGVLQRVAEVFFNKSSSDSTDFTNALEEEIAPQLAAHQDAILLTRRCTPASPPSMTSSTTSAWMRSPATSSSGITPSSLSPGPASMTPTRNACASTTSASRP